MSHSTLRDCEPNSASTLPEKPGVLVVRKHHFLVRWSHWLNVPVLLGLILSGISIYWASPIYQYKPELDIGNFDVAADTSVFILLTKYISTSPLPLAVIFPRYSHS